MRLRRAVARPSHFTEGRFDASWHGSARCRSVQPASGVAGGESWARVKGGAFGLRRGLDELSQCGGSGAWWVGDVVRRGSGDVVEDRAAHVVRDATLPPLTSYQRRVLADLG